MNPGNSKRRLTGTAQTLADDPIIARAAQIVATLPALTPAQLDTLTVLLGGAP